MPSQRLEIRPMLQQHPTFRRTLLINYLLKLLDVSWTFCAGVRCSKRAFSSVGGGGGGGGGIFSAVLIA